jgi:nucleoside-diphosphate-sugar epimerase
MDKRMPAHGNGGAEGTMRFRRKLGAPRLLIVGCGDIGLRIVARVHRRFRVFALTSSPARVAELRAAGTVPIVGNLDQRSTLLRLHALAPRLIHLAPPPNAGPGDPRTRHLLAALGKPKRAVYISTSGVYGDRGGAWVDETTPIAPANERAWRRVAAEDAMRAAGAAVLRVPGIYAHDRLPLDACALALPHLQPMTTSSPITSTPTIWHASPWRRCIAAAARASITPSTTRI